METEEEQEQGSEQGPVPEESRSAILSAIADIEAAIQRANATQSQIYDAADDMRQQTHAEIARLEQQGVRSEADEDRYRELLEDRRRCDLIGADIPA